MNPLLRMIVLTLVLLPTSCFAGKTASDMMSARTMPGAPLDAPLWFENILWLVALTLMFVWAWAINRVRQRDK